MRSRIAFAVAVAGAAIGLAVPASPASAKDVESGFITGPGLVPPIDFSAVGPGKLPALTGLWEITPGHPEPVPLLDEAPTPQLGPRYTITWRIRTGPSDRGTIRQDAYPHADGGPLVHTAAGQPIFEGVTLGGWYEAHVALRDQLYHLGMLPVGVVTPSEAAATGAVSLTVSGPGIPLAVPLEVSGATLPDGWARIETGLGPALPGGDPSPLSVDRPSGSLGPRHTLTWHMMTGTGETTPVRQDLYLHADGGPLVHTPAGQPVWRGVTSGGWYRPSADVRQALADACVPIIGDHDASTACLERRWAAKAESAGTAPVAGESGEKGKRDGGSDQAVTTVAGAPSAPDPWWPEALAGLVAAVSVGTWVGFAIRGRRTQGRERVAGIQL